MKKLVAMAIGVVSVGVAMAAAPREAHATGCGPNTGQVGKDIFTALRKVYCADTSASCKLQSKQLSIDLFNNMNATLWKGIDPRPLDQLWQSGTVYSTGSKLWVTPGTAMRSPAFVRIKKTGGKDKMGIAVCRTDGAGVSERLHEIEFDGGNDNVGKEESRKLGDNPHNYMISVFLDGKNLLNTFSYDIKLEY